MLSPNQPQKGSLMLSEPFMLDTNFKRSVVLLAEYKEEGIIGFVLNQRSNLMLKDIITDCTDADFPVFIGGPVANDTLHFIHSCPEKLNSGTEIINGIYWGGNFEGLKILIKNKQIEQSGIKFFIGYSGWGYEQLKMEMKQNSWLITQKYHPDIVFVQDEENLWKEVVISFGPKYAHIVNFPENPMWN